MMRFEQPTATKPTTHTENRSWPDAVALREAIQNPQDALADRELKSAVVLENRQGLPLAYSGRFAVVFRLNGAKGNSGTDNAWAVRCFTTPGAPAGMGIGRGERYRRIAGRLSLMNGLFVPYRYIEQGIRVQQSWYPIVAMRWATGETLGKWVEKNLQNPACLQALCGTLSAALTRMEAAGIAHGDWQHDNLLISDDGRKVTFVDYDGFYVPELKGYPAPETGHPNYQHPNRTTEHYGARQDRFACLVIQTALLALVYDPTLWETYADGESLLFKRTDFLDPENSALFQALRDLVGRTQNLPFADTLALLKDACHAAPDAVLPPVIAAAELSLSDVSQTADWETVTTSAKNAHKWWLEDAEDVVVETAEEKRVFSYIERLSHPEIVRKDTRHFLRSRIVFTFIPIFWYISFVSPSYAQTFFALFPHSIMCGLFLTYFSWPRLVIRRELSMEIKKLDSLIAEQKEGIEQRNTMPKGQQLTADEFVRIRLGNTSINGAISVPGIRVNTLRLLKRAGVANAAKLSKFSAMWAGEIGISHAEFAALRQWQQQLELEAAAEYRRLSPSGIKKNVYRSDAEILQLENEYYHLKNELDQFPNTSVWTYTKKVFGVPEKNGELPHP